MSSAPQPSFERRILILAPTGRDGQLTQGVLAEAGGGPTNPAVAHSTRQGAVFRDGRDDGDDTGVNRPLPQARRTGT